MEFQHPLQRQREIKLGLRGKAIFAEIRRAVPESVSDADLLATLETWKARRAQRTGKTGWSRAESLRQARQLLMLPAEHRMPALRLAIRKASDVMLQSAYAAYVRQQAGTPEPELKHTHEGLRRIIES